MNSRYFFAPELVYCNSGFADAISSISTLGGDHRMLVGGSTRSTRPAARALPPASFLVRMAMKVSRSRLFGFLRRVFHYQNGPRPDIGSNPFNSGTWMVTELVILAVQIAMIGYTLGVAKDEKPVWPMRIWVAGYGFGCVLSLMQLCWRYHVLSLSQNRVESQNSSTTLSDVEQQRTHDDTRYSQSINRYRTYLELFFAIWFVMGNVWVFDSRFGSFRRAPKLHILCIALLAWNAISYSFPFILFVLLCCCVPLVSTVLGYNMNMGSADRGASDEQLSGLPSWKYNAASDCSKENDSECCICLAKYKEKEDIRELPCSHIFHLKCVDQWLRIISCCPLCKQELDR